MANTTVVFNGETHQRNNGKYYATVTVQDSEVVTSFHSPDVDTELEAEELLVKAIENAVCNLKDKDPEMNTKRFWNNVEMKQA
jgi:hypothetical protein